jgi:hypothetical protein
MVATREVRSVILIGRESWTLKKGQIGSTGTGIIIGPVGMTMTGAARSERTTDEISATAAPIVEATPDSGAVIAPKVILGDGQIRRFSIIA